MIHEDLWFNSLVGESNAELTQRNGLIESRASMKIFSRKFINSTQFDLFEENWDKEIIVDEHERSLIEFLRRPFKILSSYLYLLEFFKV